MCCPLQVHLLSGTSPAKQPPTCIQRRTPGLEYFVEHSGGHLYILTNAGALAAVL